MFPDPAYNEIHKRIGGEVYIALPAYNDVHGAIALYSAVLLSLAHLNFVLHVASAYMPSPPLFWGLMRPWLYY